MACKSRKLSVMLAALSGVRLEVQTVEHSPLRPLVRHDQPLI